eukprot:gb/GEZN01022906.1/.p1 GENE.gb/GEZN01022906.1/~~gb/GEZN01022906.1/.p1  ORF type:complete len:153 (-),score=28.21 gb/GEZN01022906.1/:121-579(-)
MDSLPTKTGSDESTIMDLVHELKLKINSWRSNSEAATANILESAMDEVEASIDVTQTSLEGESVSFASEICKEVEEIIGEIQAWQEKSNDARKKWQTEISRLHHKLQKDTKIRRDKVQSLFQALDASFEESQLRRREELKNQLDSLEQLIEA